MKVNVTCCKAWQVYIMYIQIYFSSGMDKGRANRWLVGRTPPSIFEYSGINGFYSPKQAQSICEADLQCGGFTFKGSKKIKYTIPEVYFFHFINESSSYLTTDIKYPHWTSYIIGSRDHIVVSGSYPQPKGTNCHRLSRYEKVYSNTSILFEKKHHATYRIFGLCKSLGLQLLCSWSFQKFFDWWTVQRHFLGQDQSLDRNFF